MTGNDDIPAGAIGLVKISGQVGMLIRFGQWLVTKLDHVRLKTPDEAWADFQHAFVYLGDGKLIEAEPGGARIVDLAEYDGWDIYWCSNIAREHVADLGQVAKLAPSFEGTPYSFLDYFAIATRALHIPVPGLRKFIASTKHEICSALAALIYAESGAALYSTWTGYVTPLDLMILDIEIGHESSA